MFELTKEQNISFRYLVQVPNKTKIAIFNFKMDISLLL